MAKKMVTFIDPPAGWKYGFPKAVPDPQPENMLEWLLEQGYPQKEIDACGKHFYTRYWQEEVEDEQIRPS
jgi:hypothetical protein